MKNILLILVGGTICTAINEEGTLSISGKAGVHLKENFINSDSFYADKVNIELSENLFILSENMTVENWNRIIDVYRKYTTAKKYDGVIFAHGTDTLAFSASLFSLILSGTDIPVFFVSANERLSSPRSNGNDNFRYAVECICEGIPSNVYAVYKNLSDEQMYLHLASRLTQCPNYSEDFSSCGAINITNISAENCNIYFDEINKSFPKEEIKSFINIYDNWKLSECVFYLTPYVGINYSCFDYSKFSAVLHGAYHSGTVCSQKREEYTENSVLYMIDRCLSQENPVDVYISPGKLIGEVYESQGIIAKHSVDGKCAQFLYGYTNETAYAKLILAYSVFEDEEKRKEFINTQCNFENIAKAVLM